MIDMAELLYSSNWQIVGTWTDKVRGFKVGKSNKVLDRIHYQKIGIIQCEPSKFQVGYFHPFAYSSGW